jgi:hypothetical protein
VLARTSSKTRMNSSPIVLRFVSGSVTPARLREEAVAGLHVHERHVEVPSERLLDLLGLALASQPVSTNTQVSWSPTARCTSSAATAESTPPDKRAEHLRVADLRGSARPRRR